MIIPTGVCWCRCGTACDKGSFFAPGHDKRAESRIIQEVFGGAPAFIAAFGYAPKDELTELSVKRLPLQLVQIAKLTSIRAHLLEVLDRYMDVADAINELLESMGDT